VEFHELVNEESILDSGRIILTLPEGIKNDTLHITTGGTIQTACGAINVPYKLPDTLETRIFCNFVTGSIILDSINGTGK
jgi:hypothetical protein